MKFEGSITRPLEESQIRCIAASMKVPYELIEMARVFIFNHDEENFLFKNRGKNDDISKLYGLDYVSIDETEYDEYVKKTNGFRNGLTAQIFIRDKLSKTADIDMILDLNVNIIYRCKVDNQRPLLISGPVRKMYIEDSNVVESY